MLSSFFNPELRTLTYRVKDKELESELSTIQFASKLLEEGIAYEARYLLVHSSQKYFVVPHGLINIVYTKMLPQFLTSCIKRVAVVLTEQQIIGVNKYIKSTKLKLQYLKFFTETELAKEWLLSHAIQEKRSQQATQ